MLHDRFAQILALEGEVHELSQNRVKACPECKRKSRKKLVGAARIERATPTMSRNEKQGKRRKIKGATVK